MATSKFSQFLEDIDEKVLECAICLKRLQNPKSLNCQHSFCLACLEDWVKKKGKLTCPTCTKSYPIPEGGLQKLPPNTFLNNLLETLEQYKPARDHITKCVCGKAEEYYCQDCRHYLCSSCRDYHKILPISTNHKLHTVEDVRSMTQQDFALFQTFKETLATLEEAAHDYENKLQNGLKAVIDNTAKLEGSRDKSLRDIDSLVQEMIQTIMEKGDEMKNNVEIIYKRKKQANYVQMDKLKTIISEVNTKLNFLKQLLKNDEVIAMQSSETLITALKDRINEMPKTEPDDNGQILFFANKHYIASLQQCGIGIVTQSMADSLTLKGLKSVTVGQKIVAKITKADRCHIDANQLKATWTHPIRQKNNRSKVHEDDNGDYVVTGKCASPGLCRLDVSFDGEPIEQSPMVLNVEQNGLVNTVKLPESMNGKHKSVVRCEDDCLLISCLTNTMYKYKQSGGYIGKITLPQGVKIFEMFTMKNSYIAVSDEGNKCITIAKMNGEVVKSIGQEVLGDPYGINVDEASDVVYVADWPNKCVFMFDIYSGQIIRKIKSLGNTTGVIDVALTNQGHILALETDFVESCNDRLLQFDNKGMFMKVLVKGDDDNVCFERVVVDEDGNIILENDLTLQLFSSDGNFIKRINKPEDGITNLGGLCLISQHPRRLAVADVGDKTIKIYNY
ncbi:tripartite motif-containing protein 2-like [Anneissia japonica]|uniref:tripartite motif-containing protein 2-like n=1 Tax=Anneissia japonica TaxID=1529436 RepID=UPI001425AFA8|nr:tripartite motif-containing protein 2-like [Anneissia japonica]